MICRHCGCDKPCPCDGYSSGDVCQRCGCNKPCACDDYTRGVDHTERPLSEYDYRDEDPEWSA